MNNHNNKSQSKFDLEEKTAKFAEQAIDLAKRLSENSVNHRLIDQFIGSAGSLGANYCEANEAESKSDFIHKIGICKKETKETMHWIRLLARANPDFTTDFRSLWKESHELLLIFSAIVRNTKVRT